jgi:hypothetical protein
VAREYDIEWKGIKVHCKSLEDAVELLKQLETPVSPELESWTAHQFVDFTGRLQFQQKKLLWYLKVVDEASDEELRSLLDLEDNRALAGTLSGLTKVANALEIPPARVYKQTMRYEKGKPVRAYSLAPGFQKSAEEFDWPSEKEIEEFS